LLSKRKLKVATDENAVYCIGVSHVAARRGLSQVKVHMVLLPERPAWTKFTFYGENIYRVSIKTGKKLFFNELWL
jgi:hypothetical protein